MSPSEKKAESFNAVWLALRASADARARDKAGVDLQLQQHFASRRLQGSIATDAINILDLGAGTGANLRRLAPRLGCGQRWTLVDHDAHLLRNMDSHLSSWAAQHRAQVESAEPDEDGLPALYVRAEHFDLQIHCLQRDLARDLPALPTSDMDLVTGSALLDLGGADWLDSLARQCAESQCSILFALSYNGNVVWTPALADDDAVNERVDRHQLTDKGLGPSLGPEAVTHFAQRLSDTHALPVQTCRSDWELDTGETDLQRELAHGYARAATAIDPGYSASVQSWLAARLALIEAGESTLRVGHQEILVTR